MLIADEYMTDETAEGKQTLGKTPMLRRQSSRASSRCLPPIREGSLSMQRSNESDAIQTSFPQAGISSGVNATAKCQFKDSSRRRDLFSVQKLQKAKQSEANPFNVQ